MWSVNMLVLLVVLAIPAAQGQLSVSLTEGDYPSNGGRSSINIEVSRVGLHQENIFIQILPLTFSQYTALFPDLPCGSVRSLQGSSAAAGILDFNSTAIDAVIPPSPTGFSTTFPFEIGLTLDDKLETNEVFLVILNVTSNLPVNTARRCAVGRIEGSIASDQQVVRVERPTATFGTENVEVSESIGNIVIFNVVKIVNTDLTLHINLQLDGQTAGKDIIIPNRRIFIPPESSSVEVPVTIVDNAIAENTKLFILTITVTIPETRVSQSFLSRITVYDDEVVLLGFVEEEISIIEGNEAEVCFMLNTSVGNFVRFDAFTVSTSDGSAKAGEDYTAMTAVRIQPILIFPTLCIKVPSFDNNISEAIEYFTVSFDSGQETALMVIMPDSTRITIIDNDDPTAIPLAPVVQEAKPTSDGKTLIISWSVKATTSRPIAAITGTVTIGNSDTELLKVMEFTTNATERTYALLDYQEDKVHTIVICARNINGKNCSNSFSTSLPIRRAQPKLPPGMIAGIAVAAAILICCCCLLLCIFICLGLRERSKSYWPAKSQKNELKGKRRSESSSSFEDDDVDDEYEYTFPKKTAL